MFWEFIDQYGMEILSTVVLAVFGYIGMVLKKAATKYIDDKTKEKVAKNAVRFVEQVYKDLHGEDKLGEAIDTAMEMLAQKGITVTELEMRVLIEAAVAEFNKAFEKASAEGV